MSLIDTVRQSLGQEQIQQISQQIGTDPATAESAIRQALPHLVSGMQNMAQQSGAAGGASGAGGVEGLLGGLGSGGGLLDKILGHQQADVHQNVQAATGLNADSTRKLLTALAPMVVAALAAHGGQGGQGQGMGGMLGGILGQLGGR